MCIRQKTAAVSRKKPSKLPLDPLPAHVDEEDEDAIAYTPQRLEDHRNEPEEPGLEEPPAAPRPRPKKTPVPVIGVLRNLAAHLRRPIRINNAACPVCDGDMYYSPDKWLHCLTCTEKAVKKKTAELLRAARIAQAQASAVYQ